ncbi:hypothetical protein JHK84_027306 [Glycine max]|nr:hypothetical protein JHK84_027306 [Glycine max]
MIHAGAISHAHVGSASVLVGDIDDALDSEKRYLKRGVNDRGGLLMMLRQSRLSLMKNQALARER